MSMLTDLISSTPSPAAIEYRHFPTRQQAVIFRNWEILPPARLAAVLGADVDTILEAAGQMGLRTPPVIDERWPERGAITIIRNNWHLLPVEQLLKLLDWREDQLAYALKEDDFLWVKLGLLKPAVKPVIWQPLNEKELKRTAKLKGILAAAFPRQSTWRPFGFLDDLTGPVVRQPLPEWRAEPGEICLDAGWRLSCPDGSSFISGVVERFSRHLFQAFGLKLDGGDKVIQLLLEPDAKLPPESHTLEIGSDLITISGVDEAGLMRGLLWLEEAWVKRGAPCFIPQSIQRRTKFDLRLLYPYAAVYGDPFSDPAADPFPEGMLERLAQSGINGLWLQAVLYTLVPFPFDPSLSAGWEKRIAGLKRLVAKAAGYGIGLYLYLNEPRAMPLAFFERYPELAGAREGAYACLCTSRQAVRDYLRDACARLFAAVPGLAGVLTITMSENLTNCFSRGGAAGCPICAGRQPYEIVGEVNRCIEEGVHQSAPGAKVICWNWAWTEANGWSGDNLAKAVGCLPAEARLMCTSESELTYTIGGISGTVSDYTMSIPGPGPRARLFWQEALRRGMKAMAKVQLNNTWECAGVPYLPVIDLVREHLDNLHDCGVSGLMASWTLGGYPSANLKLASRYYWQDSQPAGGAGGTDDSSPAARAQSLFSAAFRSFPFHIGVLYNAPQNVGPMNLLLPEPSGYRSTMTGYPYDDLEHWRSIYPVDVFTGQLKLLSEKWQQGLAILDQAPPDPELEELTIVARAAGYHFTSAYLQALYVQQRDALPSRDDPAVYNAAVAKLRAIVSRESELAVGLWHLMNQDARLGFEASNHYFYTEGSLREKVLNCQYLLDQVFVPVVTQADLEAAMRQLGLAAGDLVLVHSSLNSLGRIQNGAAAVVDAFEALLGPQGTLVFPTLSQQDFAHSYETWHLDKPSDTGAITEYFRKLPGARRSDQATHSVAARGRLAGALTCEHTAYGPRYGIFGDYAFSRSSPWQKMYDWNGKVVFLGVTMRVNTFKHFMEYRIVDEALARIKNESDRQRLKDKIWDFRHYGNHADKIWPFHKGDQLQAALEQAGLLRKATCGKGELLCVNIREMVDTGLKWFAEDPAAWYAPDVLAWLSEAEAAARS